MLQQCIHVQAKENWAVHIFLPRKYCESCLATAKVPLSVTLTYLPPFIHEQLKCVGKWTMACQTKTRLNEVGYARIKPQFCPLKIAVLQQLTLHFKQLHVLGPLVKLNVNNNCIS